MKREYIKAECEIIELENLNIIATSSPLLNNNNADNNKPVLSNKEKRKWGNLWQ